jgi:hypothetical protein
MMMPTRKMPKKDLRVEMKIHLKEFSPHRELQKIASKI